MDGSAADEKKLADWAAEQQRLKQHLVCHDTFDWGFREGKPLPSYVAGADISFAKDGGEDACAALVVCSFPSMEVEYERHCLVKMTEPYVPGFLAFREAPALLRLIQELRVSRPDLAVQALLVDGNGILHTRGFGLACHVGVLCGIPTVGVAKNLYHVEGLSKQLILEGRMDLARAGEWFPLVGDSGQVLGAALKSTDLAVKPVYVSVGHGISLETAVELTARCCRHRVPEPIRRADMISREALRKLA